MFRNVRTLTSCFLVLALAVSLAGCQKLQARDQLNKGVQAYKNNQYDRAIDFFLEAKRLDPSLINARIYLATAYAITYTPGVPGEDNEKKARQAIAEFEEVRKMDSNNLSAIDGIGSLLFNMAGADPEKLRESKSFHVQHIQVKPSDPDPYYWVGVIEWKIAYAANVKMRKDWNDKQPDRKKVKDEQPMPPALRAEFAAQYAGGVDEGINYLKKALEIDPMYENAMAYLNLLYRQKADMAATDQEVESYLAEADKMIEKVKEVRQKKSEQPPAPTQ